MKSAKVSKKRVLQPDGTAGEDYNLQTAMGLGNDDRTYNAIHVSIPHRTTDSHSPFYSVGFIPF
jgi:hypothetical protein